MPKLPDFLKGTDKPKSRKLIILCGLLVIVLIVGLVKTATKERTGSEKMKKEMERTEQKAEAPEIQNGRDNDRVLGASDMIRAREQGRRNPSNRDIYENVGQDEDPYSIIDRRSSRDRADTAKKDDAVIDKNRSREAERTAREMSGQTKPAKGGTVSGGKARSSRRRDSISSTSAGPEAQARRTARNAEDSAQGTSVAVRRSGSISTLADWGSVEGINSLESDDRFVVQDADHPFKVMFTEDTKIAGGGRVMLRLLEDMAVDGVLIPKNTHLTATCSVGERLQIHVNSIEINGKIYQLNYTAYDTDGSQGLYCPTTEESRNANSTLNVLGNTATRALNSVYSGAGSLASDMVRIGTRAINSKGKVTVSVNTGYVFYLLKDN